MQVTSATHVSRLGRDVLLQVKRTILLLLLEILLQEHNLVLDELVHKLGHHVGRDLLGLLFL